MICHNFASANHGYNIYIATDNQYRDKCLHSECTHMSLIKSLDHLNKSLESNRLVTSDSQTQTAD